MIKQIEGDYLDSNVYIIEKDNQVLIIDSGAEIDKIKEVVGNRKVIGVLLTHGHYDHSQYCNVYAKYYNCNIYANKYITQTLSDGEAIYSEDKSVIQDFSNFIFLEGDGKIQIENFSISYYYCPGHSICCECYLIDGDLFAGDVLFDRSIGRTDLKYSDKNMMIESLKKLENLIFNNVYSGHGNPSTYAEQMKNIKVYKRFLTR